MLGVWVAPGALETLHKGGGLEVTRNETGKNILTDFKFEYPGFFDDGHCNYFLRGSIPERSLYISGLTAASPKHIRLPPFRSRRKRLRRGQPYSTLGWFPEYGPRFWRPHRKLKWTMSGRILGSAYPGTSGARNSRRGLEFSAWKIHIQGSAYPGSGPEPAQNLDLRRNTSGPSLGTPRKVEGCKNRLKHSPPHTLACRVYV